jgi:cytochrome b561
MPEIKIDQNSNEIDSLTRFIHLGITLFGILAWITGYFAGDYKRMHHIGFNIHKWLGIGLSFFILLRLIYGIIGPKNVQFINWIPFTKERLLLVWEDILTLLKFQLPDRPTHQGLSGLVQSFGLLVFSWMSITGSLMFFYLHPGSKVRGMMHFIKEIHEIGNWLIPIFLGIHGGAVILHALAGNHLWRKIFFLEK